MEKLKDVLYYGLIALAAVGILLLATAELWAPVLATSDVRCAFVKCTIIEER